MGTTKDPNKLAPEPEWKGSKYSHPYLIYVVLTVVLFVFLVVMGGLAWTQGWIPNRRIS